MSGALVSLSRAYTLLGKRPRGCDVIPDDQIPIDWVDWLSVFGRRAERSLRRVGIAVIGDLSRVCEDCLRVERYVGASTVRYLRSAADELGYPLAEKETCGYCGLRGGAA